MVQVEPLIVTIDMDMPAPMDGEPIQCKHYWVLVPAYEGGIPRPFMVLGHLQVLSGAEVVC